MDEFVEQFLIECRELAEQATSDLLALEGDPGDRQRLDSAFRAFHTLKGAAGIVDFAAMGRALHAAEDVLSEVRGGDRPVTPELIGDSLTCLDQVEQWLDAMQKSGKPPAGADAQADALIARFTSGAARAAPSAAAPTSPTHAPIPTVSEMPRALLAAQVALLGEISPEGFSGRIASAAKTAENVFRAAGLPDWADRSGGATTDAAALLGVLEAFLGDDTTVEAPEAAARRIQDTARVLRVDVERIDALVNIAGELTVVKNAFGHLTNQAQAGGDPKALAAAMKDQHDLFDRLIRELQGSVLAIRVLPLSHVFQRFPRLLREMAASTGKPARLVVEGDTTEADKAVVEGLFEPLLHLVRNAVDHGVEAGGLRAAAGKSEIATVTLRATKEGDHVVVEVTDDGAGVDVDRVREVAVSRGVVTPEAMAGLDDAAVSDLIFAPGFSTAATVSDLSGRGVGMDAVRTAVERLGGRVAIVSRPGQGTTVRIVLPFSVMISRVLTVQAGDQMFGVPLDAVVETVRLPRDRIIPVGAARAIVLRDRTIPIIDLAAALGRADAKVEGSDSHIVIASISGQFGGLEVDRLGDRLDVMLKPMDGLLSGMPGIAGTTVLGDGRVLIVLDLPELLR